MDKLQYINSLKQAKIERQEKRIAELEGLMGMILDAESADMPLIPFMYHTWLHAAKALKEGT